MPKKATKKKTTRTKRKPKPIRVGVIGVGRGSSFAAGATDLVGMKLVALCDTWEERLLQVGEQHGVATYTDYDKFLEHDMDAVVLANYFDEHAPFAIKALKAGKHVMSETSCNATLAEGVALCRAVERTGLTYMLAENYPYTAFNMEMRRVYRTGEIGKVMYAEGEYNHPMAAHDTMAISPGINHWRNWIPSTYYCTHALAPLVFMTDTMPVKVNALSMPYGPVKQPGARRTDLGSVILCRMNNDSVFRLFGLGVPGHSNWYRVHGSRGAMETTRGPGYFGPEEVRVWHDPWDLKPGEEENRVYKADWPEHGDLARASGHGGGDFWTNFEFANAIRKKKQPFLDVYRGVTMSAVGILAYRSALQDSAPLAIPDFRQESARLAYENDHWNPDPTQRKEGDPWPSVRGDITPSPEALAEAREIWREMGYTGV